MRWMVERPRSEPRFLSAPRSRVYPHVGFSRAIVKRCFTFSPRAGRRPAGLRARLPSYFAATLSRYHRRIVSGVASDVSVASSFRPSGFPFSARSRRSAWVNRRRRGPRRARSTRFSARKNSIAWPCRRLIQLPTSRMRNCGGAADVTVAEPYQPDPLGPCTISATIRIDRVWDSTA